MKKISSKEMKGMRKDVIQYDSFGCGSPIWETTDSYFSDKGVCTFFENATFEDGSHAGSSSTTRNDKEALGTNK